MSWFKKAKKAANEIKLITEPSPIETGIKMRQEMAEIARIAVRFRLRREVFLSIAGELYDAAKAEVSP